MAKKFSLISLDGTPREIDLQHGKILKKGIEKTIGFTNRAFKYAYK